MKHFSILFLIIISYLLIGCTSQKPLYHWGNYSSTLYEYKKAPNDENLINHKNTLAEIIKKSKEEGLRVPPGVYCEYGYIFMKEGNHNDALRYFDLEEQTYPESKIFMQNLKSKLSRIAEKK